MLKLLLKNSIYDLKSMDKIWTRFVLADFCTCYRKSFPYNICHMGLFRRNRKYNCTYFGNLLNTNIFKWKFAFY